MSDATDQNPMLTFEELERVVELINLKLQQYPRLVGTLVTHAVPTCIEELAAALPPVEPDHFLKDWQPEQQMSLRDMNHAGYGALGLPELLQSLCGANARVVLTYKKDGPRLTILRGFH